MFEGLGEEQVAGLANPGGLRSGRPGKRRGDSHPFDPPWAPRNKRPRSIECQNTACRTKSRIKLIEEETIALQMYIAS